MARTLIGTVTSDKMDKTIVVKVAETKQHPLYKKKYQFTTKFKAHDASGKAKLGDLVEIAETRPLSKDKRFEYVRTLTAKDREKLS